METETIKKIYAILERVKEPESGFSIAQPGLIKRIRYVKLPALKGGASLNFEGQSPSNSPKGFLPPLGIQRGKAPLSFTKNASAIHLPSKGRGHPGF